MKNNVIEIPALKYTVNKNILSRQNISHADMIKLQRFYKEKLLLEAYINITDISRMKDFANFWFENEKRIQNALKFQDNDNFIKFWELPHCICDPELNEAKYPSGNYYINEYCPLHGNI